MDDLVNSVQGAVDILRDMRAAGIRLDDCGGNPHDDYAQLVTEDPKVAEQFGFEPDEEDELDESEVEEDENEVEDEESEPIVFEYEWSRRFVTRDAKSIDEMIDWLQAAADDLRKMRAAGILLDPNSDIESGYPTLLTDDPKVAEQFGFEEPWNEERERAEEEAWRARCKSK